MNCSLASTLALALITSTSLAHATGHTLANSRLSVTFGDTAAFPSTDADRVDAISWTNSAHVAVTNWVANGGPQHCGDPQEFFGQSYGEPEGTYPLMVFAGISDSWTGTAALNGKAKTSVSGACDTPPGAVTKTAYKLFTAARQINELQVSRTFVFNASTPLFSTHGLRAYVPRLPINVYSTTLIPNAAGTAINPVSNTACVGDCEVTDWNGRWFAEDDGAGNGIMVIRSTGSTAPALVAVNWDSYSSSALSSIVLIQPTAGWKTSVAETEYLCFYDATTWTTKARASGKLPVGCMGTKP